MSSEPLKVALFQKVQGNFLIAQIAKIIIPFYYPELLHPVHGIDKSIIYFDTFLSKKHYGCKCNYKK